MKTHIIFFCSLIVVRIANADLYFKADYSISEESLTTEKAWEVNPKSPNPHLQRWALNRDVHIEGLRATEKANSKNNTIFHVQADGVISATKIYLRTDGPWFRDFSEFQCDTTPNSWFSVKAGNKIAAVYAATLWHEILKTKKDILELLLQKVSASSSEIALLKAKLLFNFWYETTEKEWLDKVSALARKEEWQYYLKFARENKICNQKQKNTSTPPPAEALVELPNEAMQKVLLTRAPARRWGGRYSVRLTLDVSDKILVGQFLLDTGTQESIVSLLWLEGQGIPSELVLVKEVLPKKILWTFGTGVVQQGVVLRTHLSGYALFLKTFSLLDVELFGPPSFAAACCDGVLGMDFFKNYVVELDPRAPTEVKIWDKNGFSGGSDYFWIEVSQNNYGDFKSHCELTQNKNKIYGARWDTGKEEALLIHSPWIKKDINYAENFALSCAKQVFASKIFQNNHDILIKKSISEDVKDSNFTDQKYPGITIGMGFLGRAPVIFDFPHGRIWFSKKHFELPVFNNESGLKLTYKLNKNKDRELVVSSLQNKASVEKLGLTIGTKVIEMDLKSTLDMDQSEINDRLSGVYGDKVILKWKTHNGYKIAPMMVR
ncbi:MAG: hypothetical protein HY072_07530 [Deltaproteobacteria bacterium]|nr:hypothetical protein [Deltaproteobacteria bacterium]